MSATLRLALRRRTPTPQPLPSEPTRPADLPLEVETLYQRPTLRFDRALKGGGRFDPGTWLYALFRDRWGRGDVYRLARLVRINEYITTTCTIRLEDDSTTRKRVDPACLYLPFAGWGAA